MNTTTQHPRIRAGHPSEGTASAQRLLMHRGGFAAAVPAHADKPSCGNAGQCWRQSTCADHYCPGHPVNNPPTRPAMHTEPDVPTSERAPAARAAVWRWYLGGLVVAAVLVGWLT